VRVLKGKVYDIAIDLRKNSATFGEWVGLGLSGENKCDEYYHPEAEAGRIYNDLSIGIDWKIPERDVKLSEKDKLSPELKKAKINIIFV
jgi:dTDP-4-dehydrorhamnose 3,5-epimerase